MTAEAAATPLTEGGQALLAALAAEDALYTSMLGLCRQEEDAIVSADVAALTALTEQKEQLIEHLNALETERMTALVAIAAATDDLDAGAATLSRLETVLPPGLVARLAEQGQELRRHAQAVDEANRQNAALLRNSRELVDRWIQYLRTLLTGSLYGAAGAGREVAGGRTLDRSA